MNEIASLDARARKYLESAELLLNAGDYESSVSRAYYAMFYMVQASLLKIGKTATTHKGVLSLFGEHFIKNGVFQKSVARTLAVAFEKRQLGDYESDMVIEKDDAEDVLTSAKETVALLNEWLNQ